MLLRGKSGRVVGAVLGVLLSTLVGWALVHGSANTIPAGQLTNAAAAPISDAVGPRVGMVAPDFALTDVNTGAAVQLTALRGRPVWLNFWATWCEACKTELPIMAQMYARYHSRGLVLVGVDVREEPAQVRAFTITQRMDWQIVIDSDVGLRNRYNTIGIPYHVFIDAHGLIQAVSSGVEDRDVLQANLVKILDP